MSQRCPTCRLYNPDTALRCDCGYDFQAKEKRPSYLLAETARKHGGFKALLQLQARRNIGTGVTFLGIGLAIALVTSFFSEPVEAGQRRGLVPAGLIVWGVALVVRGYNQRSAAARLTDPKDSPATHLVDGS